MTYQELIDKLTLLNDEQRKMNVTVYMEDWVEFCPVTDFRFNNIRDDDRLDDGHPFVVLG